MTVATQAILVKGPPPQTDHRHRGNRLAGAGAGATLRLSRITMPARTPTAARRGGCGRGAASLATIRVMTHRIARPSAAFESTVTMNP